MSMPLRDNHFYTVGGGGCCGGSGAVYGAGEYGLGAPYGLGGYCIGGYGDGGTAVASAHRTASET